MDGTGEHMLNKGQKLDVFPHMWKLDLKDKCIYTYIHIWSNEGERERERERERKT
jgi:hypothetical protein